ncbi:hypothetical protein VU05_04695 [Desulfobulbus sp. F1]|nr:hypothetical protein [Desulfobulbus sp. F1]
MIAKKFFFLVVGLLVCSQANAATYLYFNSEAGDYIGQGLEQTWTEDNGTFSVSRNYDNGISVSYQGSDWWSLDFTAPSNAQLMAGPYENAERFPFQSPTLPGLNVSGSGRGCNTLTGRFNILDVEYDTDGKVLSFAADFEQHCEGMDPALFGSIRYNSSIGAAPQVNMTANGSRDPIIIKSGDKIVLSASVEAGERAGENAEIWLGLQGPYNNLWHNGSILQKRILPYSAGPLSDLKKDLTLSLKEPGIYLGVLAMDMNIDGRLKTDYTDYIVITVK